MAKEIEIDVKGIAETQKAISQFSEKLGDRVTRIALRSGANFMLKRIRAAAPKKTGRLRRATVVKQTRHTVRRSGKVRVYITIKKGRKRDDKRGAYYGPWVEHGHKARGSQQGKGRFVSGRHFIKRTYSSTKSISARLIVRNIEQGGKTLLSQIGKRNDIRR